MKRILSKNSNKLFFAGVLTFLELHFNSVSSPQLGKERFGKILQTTGLNVISVKKFSLERNWLFVSQKCLTSKTLTLDRDSGVRLSKKIKIKTKQKIERKLRAFFGIHTLTGSAIESALL